MTGLAVLTMVVICGVVWGGFAVLLSRALRREGVKSRAARVNEHRRPSKRARAGSPDAR